MCRAQPGSRAAPDYAYLFIRSPPKCWSADGTTTLASYWFKIPALLYALRLCQLAGPSVRGVLILDTDVSRDFSVDTDFTLEDVVRDVENKTAAPFDSGPVQIVFSADAFSFWVRLLWRQAVYGRGGINSGAVLVRPTARAHALLAHLWYNWTRELSPYETSRVAMPMWAAATVADRKNLIDKNVDFKRVPPAYAAAQAAHPDLLPSAIVGDVSALLTATGFRLSYSLSPRAGAVAELARIKHCCDGTVCAELLLRELLAAANKVVLRGQEGKNLSLVNFTAGCGAAVHGISTLVTWPGDQDRLNWLYDVYRTETASSTPALALSLTKGWYQPMLLFHWAEGQDIKAEFAQRASNRTWRLIAPALESWDDWESRGAWEAIAARVPSWSLDGAASNMSTAEALRRIDAGAFRLVNAR